VSSYTVALQKKHYKGCWLGKSEKKGCLGEKEKERWGKEGTANRRGTGTVKKKKDRVIGKRGVGGDASKGGEPIKGEK